MANDAGKEMTPAERIFVRISVMQTILAVVGMFVGVAALYAALSESDAVRKQQQASVWPRLQFSRSYYGIPGQERFDIVVGNRGIGPAKVQSASVSVSGKAVKTWMELAKKFSGAAQIGISDDVIADKVIAPGEDILVFSIEENFAAKETIRAIRDAYDEGRILMHICYCSVFGSCWSVSTDSPRETPAKQCEAQDVDLKF